MAAQGHTHVVDLHGDGIAAQQAFVQQFDPRALDEAQLQKAAFQFEPMLVARMVPNLHYDATITATGLAEFQGI